MSQQVVEARVEALARYPVKSCGAIAAETLAVETDHIVGDRRFMLVREGRLVNQKEVPALAPVRVDDADPLRLWLTHPDAGSMAFDVRAGDADGDGRADLYGSPVVTVDQGDAVADWFAAVTGLPGVRLVALATPCTRALPLPLLARLDGRRQGGFADLAPLLLVSRASLDALAARLGAVIPFDRFRPNLVIDGELEAFAEHEIDTIDNGSVRLEFGLGCERCAVTTTDQTTGERTGREPLRELAQFRRRGDQYAGGVLFGVYLRVARAGTLRVGETLRITLDSGRPAGRLA